MPERHLPLSSPRDVGVHIGARLRLRRVMLGMSQEKLGEATGLSFRQVQNYEHGTTGIGANSLEKMSDALDVAESYFRVEISLNGGTRG